MIKDFEFDDLEEKKVTLTDGTEIYYEYLINSMPFDRFLKLTNNKEYIDFLIKSVLTNYIFLLSVFCRAYLLHHSKLENCLNLIRM